MPDVLHSESRLIDLRFFLILFEGSLRWKENVAQKAAAAFLRRQQDTTNLQKLVYGNGRIWTSWPRDPGVKRADDNYCCCCCCCCCFSFVFPVPTPLLPESKLFQFLWFITVSLFLFSSCFDLSLSPFVYSISPEILPSSGRRFLHVLGWAIKNKLCLQHASWNVVIMEPRYNEWPRDWQKRRFFFPTFTITGAKNTVVSSTSSYRGSLYWSSTVLKCIYISSFCFLKRVFSSS